MTLGPLLFVLYINDLPDNIKSSIKLFADDLKLIGNVHKYNDIIKDLHELEYWESIWLLNFNHLKCKVLHIDLNNNPKFDYFINGHKLLDSVQEKDLGVLTSDSILWTDQINPAIYFDFLTRK